MDELILFDDFLRILRRWWWIAIAMLVGSCLGWGYHRLQPPIYEAKATFVVGIDFSRADAVPHWDQDRYEEDLMIGAIKSLMVSTAVLDQLAADLLDHGIPLDVLQYGKTTFVERKQNEMTFRVRHPSPETAALIANLWAARAEAALQEAASHALRAQTLRNSIESLKTCSQNPVPENPAELCRLASLAELEQRLVNLEAELTVEMQAARAISPTAVFTLSQNAAIPEQPILFEANRLILAGALIGLVIAIFLAMSWRR